MGRRKIIVSLGGNAIVRRGERGTIEEQFENARISMAYVARMVEGGGSIIITHGNGPIVGNILIQNEAVRDIVPPMPLYICDADSEGGIGFLIQQTLYNRLRKDHRIEDVVAVVTQVVVDAGDPAFENPTKPIGPYYSKNEAEVLIEKMGWKMVEDSRRGYRRVVPSPKPLKIVEARAVKKLSESGVVVIAAGGGGVPVVEEKDGTLRGVDAVVDKDLSTSVLARETGAELFINLTQTDSVYLDFGGPKERPLREMNVEQARGYLAQGHFAPGSMGPKIEAAVDFLEHGGKEVVITTPELLEEALKGRAGTRIHR